MSGYSNGRSQPGDRGDGPRGNRATQSGVSPPARSLRLFNGIKDNVGHLREFATDTDIREFLTEAGPFPSKKACPMFSPGIFPRGRIKGRTPAKFTLVVGEHDAGKVGVDEASARLEKAGIAAFIYTSASHTSEHPRWRVVAPLQQPSKEDQYLPLLGVLNGALGGCLAPESADLKRRWFYGSVEGAVDYRTGVVQQGKALDAVAATEHGIEPIEVKPPKAKTTKPASAPPEPITDHEIDRAISALQTIPNPGKPEMGYDRWRDLAMALHAATGGHPHALDALIEWTKDGQDEKTTAIWNGFKVDGGIGPGTLFRAAHDAGWVDPSRAPSAEGLEAIDESGEPVDVEAEKSRLLDVFVCGGQTDADRESLARMPGEVQAAVLEILDLIGGDGAEQAREVIEKAAAVRASSLESVAARDFDMNDAGNVAMLVALQNGDMRYDPATEEFMFWRNARWERDEHGTIMREAISAVARCWSRKSKRTRAGAPAAAQREAAAGAKSTGGRKRMDGHIPGGAAAALEDLADKQAGWAKACGNLKQINAMKVLAKVDAAVVIDPAMLDRDPYLLGVANGVVDLRTAQLRADARDEFVTRRVPVVFKPEAKAPRWEQFQREICGLPLPRAKDGSHPYTERPALVAYKRRWAGSMLIGENVGQKFYTATGEGSNGKSLELETYVEIMGPLAVKLPGGAFMAGNRGPRDADAASPTLAALRGARLALASETESGSALNTGDVKAVTGDAQITARGLFENGSTFRLEATPVLLTNHPPTIRTVDNAINGRIAIVPYERTWNRPDEATPDPERPDADPGLKAALRAESEGILAWMVAGAGEVLAADGALHPPTEVTGRTDDYLRAQTVFAEWLETLERCEHRKGMKSTELLGDFRRYAQTIGRPAGREAENERRFGDAMQRYAARVGIERNQRSKCWPLRSTGRGAL